MIHELGIIEHGPGNDTSLVTSSSHSYAYLHSQGRIRSQITRISTPQKDRLGHRLTNCAYAPRPGPVPRACERVKVWLLLSRKLRPSTTLVVR